jgi:hypothetical protein
MTVAYAALHHTLRFRGEDTNLFVAAFDDGRMFFSRVSHLSTIDRRNPSQQGKFCAAHT